MLLLGELIVFIIMAGFFSGLETGFVSFSPLKVEVLRKEKPEIALMIERLRGNWKLFLATALVGNDLAVVSASAIFTLIMNNSFGIKNEFIITIIFSVILLLLAEAGPKVIFRYYNKYLIPITVPIFTWFVYLFYPVSWIFIKLSKMLLLLFGLNDKETGDGVFVTREELRRLLSQGYTAHALHREERSMMKRIFDFSSKKAEDIMTPLESVVFIEMHSSMQELINLMKKVGYSRYPVRNSDGKIVGFLHILDIIFLPRDADWHKYIRPVVYIYSKIPVGQLFYHMQSMRANMVIVYGEDFKPRGIITMKDIMDEIVGEVV